MVHYVTWLIATFGLLFSSLTAQIVSLTSIDPDSAAQGDNLSVYIIGQGTNFYQGSGATSVWFVQGSSTISSYSFWPGSNTTLTADFAIPIDAPIGLWDLSVNSSADGTLTLADAFTVNPAGTTPEIISIDPDSAAQGDNLSVYIIGQGTNFTQGSGVTNVRFVQGSSTISSYSFWPESNTTLTSHFAIPIDAPIGLWDLSVNSSADGTLTLVDGITIFPFRAAPAITAITDVPDDQGGWIYLSWFASVTDALGEITQYGVWELSPEEGWVSLGNVPSIHAEEYTYLAHTFGDSTMDDIFWSRFMVTAHTTDPEVFYTSAVDSGYSIDNLAPAVPTGLLASITGENTVQLTWPPPVDEDFDYFRIYRDVQPDFDPTGTEPLAEVIDTTLTDSEVATGATYYYRISAVDFNGNESEYSEAVDATVLSTDNELGIPTEFALRQNYPNPFNPVSTIRYNLPQASYVSLTVYNILGRDVAKLVDSDMEPGYHQAQWDGRNNQGMEVPSGIYIARMVTPGYSQSIKMVLLK
jgi:hypothetical protein